MLKAEKIVKKYAGICGENTVLDNLDFHLGKGQLCIITGRSGCGKSTLLNVLSCLDTFDSGYLEINGKAVNDMTPNDICRLRRSDTAFIFQGYNLISSMTARENVELGLKYRKVNSRQRTQLALDALEQVGLSHRTEHLPHQLSGGQQQRVAIARALVLKPKVLFCDEPTGNLDKESTALVLDKICRIKQNGACVVMITHDLSLLPLADKVCLLENGKLIMQ
ncbi:MAG: ABC transporter ATP-binding protein [Ruminococcaceae bacterium]|nr:ABC transporter ATP-binding protein [Oscillospiraceae bacterium]